MSVWWATLTSNRSVGLGERNQLIKVGGHCDTPRCVLPPLVEDNQMRQLSRECGVRQSFPTESDAGALLAIIASNVSDVDYHCGPIQLLSYIAASVLPLEH